MDGNLRRGSSELRYARSADAHIAYRVLEGETTSTADVVLVLGGGTMPMDALFDDPVALRFVEGLADLGRLVVFDRCGIGLSDPLPSSGTSALVQWRQDLEAVIEGSGLVRPVLVTQGLGVGLAILHCDRNSENVSSLVLVSPGIRPFDPDVVRRQIAGEADSVALWFPSRADDPSFREWFENAGRRGASPGAAARAYEGTAEDELRLIETAAARLRIPTLVLRRPGHPITPSREDDHVLALLPGAVRVDLPGSDLFAWGAELDALLSEVTAFVTGEHRPPVPERVLGAVLFTDLVASTERATALGDDRWKRLIDRHDKIATSCIARRGGTVIKTMGDAILAILPSANSAFDAAVDLRAALEQENLELRVGIHVGDVDRRGSDLSGVGVTTAARIQSLAGRGEILASATAAQAANGGTHHFEPRGEYQLKGVAGTWQVVALTEPNPPTRT